MAIQATIQPRQEVKLTCSHATEGEQELDLKATRKTSGLRAAYAIANLEKYKDRGALRGTPGSAYPLPEPNATELPSSAPGRPQASAPSPTRTRAEEHIATTPD